MNSKLSRSGRAGGGELLHEREERGARREQTGGAPCHVPHAGPDGHTLHNFVPEHHEDFIGLVEEDGTCLAATSLAIVDHYALISLTKKQREQGMAKRVRLMNVRQRETMQKRSHLLVQQRTLQVRSGPAHMTKAGQRGVQSHDKTSTCIQKKSHVSKNKPVFRYI